MPPPPTGTQPEVTPWCTHDDPCHGAEFWGDDWEGKLDAEPTVEGKKKLLSTMVTRYRMDCEDGVFENAAAHLGAFAFSYSDCELAVQGRLQAMSRGLWDELDVGSIRSSLLQ